MRFLIIPSLVTEGKTYANAPFDQAHFTATMQYNEDMFRAGVLVASEGLNPGATGAHVLVKNGKRRVVDGPFAESKELVAGFWLIEVGSRAEAVEWALRCPVNPWGDEVLELRQLTGAEDLPAELVSAIKAAAPTWSEAFGKRAAPPAR